jgi:hypothetical protein
MGPRRPDDRLSVGAYIIAFRERFRPERAVGRRIVSVQAVRMAARRADGGRVAIRR